MGGGRDGKLPDFLVDQYVAKRPYSRRELNASVEDRKVYGRLSLMIVAVGTRRNANNS